MNFEEADLFRQSLGPQAVSIMEEDERCYLYGLAGDPQNHPVVELGVSSGGTTILLALAAGKVVAIDNGEAADFQKHFHANIIKADLQDSVQFIQSDAATAAQLFSDAHFGMILLDANHWGEYPYLDIQAWTPKLRVGGYLLVDDWWIPDIEKGMGKYLEEHPTRYKPVKIFIRQQGAQMQKKLAVYQRTNSIGV